MARSISVDHRAKIVYSTLYGTITDQELLSQCAEASALPVSSDYRELIDMTGVTELNVSGQTVRAVASRPSPFSKEFPRVILVSRAEHYGLGRMAQSYAELGGAVPFAVVESKEAAAKILRVDLAALK